MAKYELRVVRDIRTNEVVDRYVRSRDRMRVYESKEPAEYARLRKLAVASARRRAFASAMSDVGMVRVRGNMGGTYWE